MIECIFPTGSHISPGEHVFHMRETWLDLNDETQTKDWTERLTVAGTLFKICGREFIVVQDDNEEFWGAGGKTAFIANVRERNIAGMKSLADQGLFDFDPVKNMPLMIPIPIKISEWQTFAQVLKEIKVFESIGQAKKAGWDKPLTLGIHEFTKKRIRIEVIE